MNSNRSHRYRRHSNMIQLDNQLTVSDKLRTNINIDAVFAFQSDSITLINVLINMKSPTNFNQSQQKCHAVTVVTLPLVGLTIASV
jgi:hypothetical protein